MWRKVPGLIERLRTGVNRECFVALQLQQQRQRIGRIAIVVDHEYALMSAIDRLLRQGFRWTACLRDSQREGRTEAQTCASADNGAAVHLRELATHGESDAESAL